MEQFFTVVTQVGIFAIMCLMGIIAIKCKILDEHSLRALSLLAMRILLPAFIFANTVTSSTRAELVKALPMIPAAAALYLVLWLLGHLIVRLFRVSPNRARILRNITMFANAGFMGIPIITGLYPEHGMVYLSVYLLVDSLLFWTYGDALTYPAGARQGGLSLKSLKMLLNPALIGVVLGVIFVLLDIRLPEFFITALSKIGAASTPVALIYIGASLCTANVRSVLRCPEIYATIVLKMMILPAVFYTVLRAVGAPQELSGVAAFMMGLSSNNTCAMLAKNHGSDGEYAVCSVTMTTASTMITLPVVALLISLANKLFF